MAHRSDAQKAAGVTASQHAALSLGRVKGTNHRAGYKHREDSKAKVAAANKAFWANNPDKLKARGAKLRAELHYNWKGGSARLNTSIRQMHENRLWIDAVKARDGGVCVRCGSDSNIESHHKVELSVLTESLGIRNRADARAQSAVLFDLDNGETLCRKCHYAHHGRAYRED